MANASAILQAFSDRQDDQRGYAGELSAKEAWQLLSSEDSAALIDVRTQPEWVFVGMPSLSSIAKQTLGISWKLYPTMEVNAQFVAQLEQAVPDKNTPLCFMCKVGGRSLDAAIAATQAGYRYAYNITHGFEGDRNDAGQRGTVNGWQATGLDWEQQ